jgi:hypothetical protein
MMGLGQRRSPSSNLRLTGSLRVLLPEYGKIGQGVSELLSGHHGNVIHLNDAYADRHGHDHDGDRHQLPFPPRQTLV